MAEITGRRKGISRPNYEHTTFRLPHDIYSLLSLYAIKQRTTLVQVVEQELRRYVAETLREYLKGTASGKIELRPLAAGKRKYRERGSKEASANISFWHRITEEERRRRQTLLDQVKLAAQIQGLSISRALEEHFRKWADQHREEIERYVGETVERLRVQQEVPEEGTEAHAG